MVLEFGVEYINEFGRQLIGGRMVEGKPIREALPDVEEKELFKIIDDVYENGREFTRATSTCASIATATESRRTGGST